MRYLKYLALITVLIIPAAFAHSQVAVGVGVGFGPGYVAGPPICRWGYYDYYPYACAPYGYYGSDWFTGGVFIGAGPWYHSYWGHSYWGSGYYGRGYYGRGGWDYNRGFHERDYDRGRGYDRGERNSYRGGYGRGYGSGSYGGYARPGFHGGGGFRGGHR